MSQIDKNNIPKHIAITMDGNGRWAKEKGKIRVFGHQNGVEAVRETVKAAAEIGIKFLTLYAFSTENWRRPKNEINSLMSLLVSAINKETKTLIENNISLSTIGNTESLPEKAKKELNKAINQTKGNNKMNLILALSYSGKWDIINATKSQEFLEATHKHKGVSHHNAVCETDYGIAWCNEHGVYLYNGRQVGDLFVKEGVRFISESLWSSFYVDGETMVGFSPKSKQLIIIKSFKNIITLNIK